MPKPQADPSEEQRSRRLALLQRTRWNNAILVVMIVLSVSGFTYLNFIWDPAAGFSDTELMNAAANQLVKDADTIIIEGATLATKAAPPVSDALVHQVKADLPVYLRTLEEQGEILADDLKDSLVKKLKAQFKQYLVKHHKVLEEELPDVAKANAIEHLKADFERAMERLINRYYVDEFVKQTKRTQKLWRQVEPVKEPPQEDSLEDDLLNYMPKWAALRLMDYAE